MRIYLNRRAAAILLLVASLLEINCAGGGQSRLAAQNDVTAPAADQVSSNQENAGQTNARRTVAPPDTAAAPLVELTAPDDAQANAPLTVHWKISNPTAAPVFVYSALLEKKAAQFVEVEPNAARKTVEIRFTRLSKIPVEPNFFPDAAFLKIESGKAVEGDFNLPKLPAGEWSATASIAYGGEIESVQKAAAARNGEHPINPVVAWQKLAVSKPVQISVK